MKIDKHNPVHWLLLTSFAIQAITGLILRPFMRKSAIVLYGHRLNGNLLPLYQGCSAAVFVSMDRTYCRALQRNGIRSQWACSFGAAMLLARTRVLVSDHGLHSLEPLLPSYRKAGLKCVDVWHGVPFKGFDADDFRLQRHYDEVWVASESQRQLWIRKFGFPPGIVHATGYARVDRLIRPDMGPATAKQRLGLKPETCGKTLLFAPTWRQDDKGRSIYPFGCTEQTFMGALSTIAARHGATVLLRSHLNSDAMVAVLQPNILQLPSRDYPDTESILLASDILICDWSSIAFDFLLLDRPTLFLDVPPPFRKGFSLGPEYRFGAVIGDLSELLQSLETCLVAPERYWQHHQAGHQSTKLAIYGECADGNATQRCVNRLNAILHTAARS
ncbi:CDP-glycerol glycerophosphotransferase family protein [Stenotrophomonas sp. NLF4-10]|uniref:CDP-glycerol glycerophosphotransferase family protein n=1 Tax=Stenotrophomonas sp. NLF4-10 TaxID=2918754 RepID=UPI001EFA67B0|nr:CDP-glycerol glycerophosphotransferase family protein [Stenotrophomonas sp. NLF4-10]MCG8277389.1 CDP-glycerol glycerophosphotransferase family protein [Stenotrophomonas sp. NLF4-10]